MTKQTETMAQCAWCGREFVPAHGGAMYCSREHGVLMRRRRAGSYPLGDCPRCGRHDYVHESPDFGVCLTCGYYPGSDRGSGLIVTRPCDPSGGANRVRQAFEAAGVSYVTWPNGFWDA